MCLRSKGGDQFGVFEVKEANENYLLLYNQDKQIDLGQNTVQPLYGDLKFKIADKDDALRFYPFVEQTIQASPKVELKASSATQTAAVPTATQNVVSAQAPSMQSALTGVQTPSPTPVKTATESAAQKLLGFWGFYAVLGLSGAAYFVLRKKD